jgi:hypothetical protein
LLAASAAALCVLGHASAEPQLECVAPGKLRVWRTENLPAGLGIRHIQYAHDADQPTKVSTRLFAYHRGTEIVPAPLLKTKSAFAYSPKHPLIRKGYAGSGVAFFLSAYAVDAHGKRIDAPCVKFTRGSTFEDVELYSDRAAAAANTRIRFEFSNSR